MFCNSLRLQYCAPEIFDVLFASGRVGVDRTMIVGGGDGVVVGERT